MTVMIKHPISLTSVIDIFFQRSDAVSSSILSCFSLGSSMYFMFLSAFLFICAFLPVVILTVFLAIIS